MTDDGNRSTEFVRDDGRTHIPADLMRQTLLSRALDEKLDHDTTEEVALLPWAKLINIGGSSIMDRGAAAILPLLEEIVELRKEHHLIVSVGGGARLRHTLAIGADLGLPIGGLAQIVGAVEEQNASMLHALLSQHGGVSMCREHFSELPKYLLTGMTPIVISVPPYHMWEPPPREGDLPENGSDLGAYLTAEVLGVEQMIFLKDRPGLFTRDPAQHDGAEHIPVAKVADLIDRPQEDLILERQVLRALNRARHVREVKVIDGLERGALKRALAGEEVGTRIQQDPPNA
jgi:molybdenum storage protein